MHVLYYLWPSMINALFLKLFCSPNIRKLNLVNSVHSLQCDLGGFQDPTLQGISNLQSTELQVMDVFYPIQLALSKFLLLFFYQHIL